MNKAKHAAGEAVRKLFAVIVSAAMVFSLTPVVAFAQAGEAAGDVLAAQEQSEGTYLDEPAAQDVELAAVSDQEDAGLQEVVAAQEEDVSVDALATENAIATVSEDEATAADGATTYSEGHVAGVTSDGSSTTTYYYTTLDAAISAAATGSTIQLQADVALTSAVTVSGKSLTLDLNGCKITRGEGNTTSYLIGVGSGASLTVCDTSSGAAGSIYSSTYTSSSATYAGYGILTNGTVEVASGTVSGYYGIYVSNAENSSSDASLTVSGGTVKGDNRAINATSGTVTVSGGTVGSDSTTYGIIQSGGTLNISGGEITGSDRAVQVSGTAEATITGGTLTGANYGLIQSGGSVKMSGGTLTGANYGLIQSGGSVKMSGGTLSGYTYGAYVCGTSASFTVSDNAKVQSTCTAEDSDDSSYTSTSAICISDGASVEVCGGTVAGGYCGVSLWQGSPASQETPTTLTVGGGEISGLAFGVSTNGSNYYCDITVNGGEITGGSHGMYLPAMESSTTINGGKITGGNTGIEIRAGELTVTGGTITGNGKSNTTEANGNGTTVVGAGIAVSQHTTKKDVTVTITGGTITGCTGVYEVNHNSDTTSAGSVCIEIGSGTDAEGNTTGPTITGTTGSAVYSASLNSEDNTGQSNSVTQVEITSGGTFSSDVSEYCTDGYETIASQDGSYSVTALTADSESTVASVTVEGVTTYYRSLVNAIDYAAENNSGTVKLLKTATLSEDVETTASVTLELSGNDLTIEQGATLTINGEGITVSIVDSNGSGLVTHGGTIAVESGTLDLSKLGYAADDTGSGLAAQAGGTISLGANGTFVVPGAWETLWAWNPNMTSFTSSSGILTSAETGARVASGGDTWTCTTAFTQDSYDSATTYWTMYSVLNQTTGAVYSSINDAIAEAAEGDVIQLRSDIAEDVVVSTGKNITLDLNGYTLSNVSSHTISVACGATLVIIDGSTGQTGKVTVGTANCAALYSQGNVTVEGGTFSRTAGQYYTIVNDGWDWEDNGGTQLDDTPTMTFEEGAVVETSADVDNNSSMIRNFGGTMNVKGGTFTSDCLSCIKNEPNSTLTIDGGTITNEAESASTKQGAIINAGTVTINGGTIYSYKSAVFGTSSSACGTLSITGGDFHNLRTDAASQVVGSYQNGATSGSTSQQISGGTFYGYSVSATCLVEGSSTLYNFTEGIANADKVISVAATDSDVDSWTYEAMRESANGAKIYLADADSAFSTTNSIFGATNEGTVYLWAMPSAAAVKVNTNGFTLVLMDNTLSTNASDYEGIFTCYSATGYALASTAGTTTYEGVTYNTVTVYQTVTEASACASITVGGETTYYATVAAAVTAANSLDAEEDITVTALQDQTTTAVISPTRSMTIDLNGCKVKSSNTNGAIRLTSSADPDAGVTVLDSSSDGSGELGRTVSNYKFVQVAAGTLVLASGTYTGTFGSISGGTLSITGGTYTSDPSAYVADGWTASESSGTYSIVPQTQKQDDSVASVKAGQDDAVYYSSFANALAAAGQDSTVTLHADVEVAEALTLSESVTLDLNDCALTVSETYGSLIVPEGVTLKVVDSGNSDEASIIATVLSLFGAQSAYADDVVHENGTYTVYGTLDISELDCEIGGVATALGGTIVLTSTGSLVVPEGWQLDSSTLDENTSSIFSSVETGATVVRGGTTFTCSTAYPSEDTASSYWSVYVAQVTASTGEGDATTTYYASFADALTAANAVTAESGATAVKLTMLDDVTYSAARSQPKVTTAVLFTLEMNGYDITFSGSYSYLAVGANTNVTIQNSSEDESVIKNTSTSSTNAYALFISSAQNANVTVKNVTLTSEKNNASYLNAATASLTLVDCNASTNATSTSYYGVKGYAGSLTVESGTYDRIYANLSQGASFGTQGGPASDLTVDYLYAYGSGNLAISSGTYSKVSSSTTLSADNVANIDSQNAVFYDVSSCSLPAGYGWFESSIVGEEGRYYIEKLDENKAAAKIVTTGDETSTPVYYDTLGHATEAATSGQTVVLLKDHFGGVVQIKSYGVTLDMNGHSITQTGTGTTGAVYVNLTSTTYNGDNTVTITNSGEAAAITGYKHAVKGYTYASASTEVKLVIDTTDPAGATNITLSKTASNEDVEDASILGLDNHCYVEDTEANRAYIQSNGFAVTAGDNDNRIYGKYLYAANAAQVDSEGAITVTMLADYIGGTTNLAMSSTTSDASTIRLDMGGYTWTCTKNGSRADSIAALIFLEDYRDYEICNGSFVGSGKYCAAVQIYNSGTCTADLTLTNVTMTLTNEDYPCNFGLVTNGTTGNSHSIVLDNTTIDAQYCDWGAYFPSEGSLTLINGSKIIGKRTGIEIRGGSLTVQDSTVQAVDTTTELSASDNTNGATVRGAGIAISQHTTDHAIEVTIEDSEISGCYGIYEVNYNLANNSSQISIEVSGDDTVVTGAGGDKIAVYSNSLDSASGHYDESGNTAIDISGGLFSSQVAVAYCAEGYVPSTENSSTGLYTVIYAPEYTGNDPITITDISSATITGLDFVTYGDEYTPVVTLGAKTLGAGSDYTVAYYDSSENLVTTTDDEGNTVACAPTAAGKYRIVVTGTDVYDSATGTAYDGTASAVFTIDKLELAKDNVDVTDLNYDGNAKEVTVTVGDTTLEAGTDYAVSYLNYDHTNAGTFQVLVAGQGNYSGFVFEEFTIKPLNLTGNEGVSVSVAEGAVYGDAAVEPAVTVTLSGTELAEGADYTVSYENNTAAGTGTAKVTFTGNYTGTASANFTITAAVASVTDADGATGYYASIDDAIAAATDGCTIKLLDDVTLASAIVIDKSITIDGSKEDGGTYTISGNNDSAYAAFQVEGTDAIDVTIENVTLQNFGSNAETNTGGYTILVNPGSADTTVTISEVTINNVNRYGIALRGGTTTIDGCMIIGANTSGNNVLTNGISAYGTVDNYARATIINTKIMGTTSTYDNWASSGINIWEYSNIAVTGCTIKSSNTGVALVEYNGHPSTLVLSDTTVEAGGNAVLYQVNTGSGEPNGSCSLVIESGSYTGGEEYNCIGYTGDGDYASTGIAISGGTYNTEIPDSYCIEGYEAYVTTDSDGNTWKIAEEGYAEASVTTSDGKTAKYETLEAAIEAAENATGEVTVTLLKDAETTETIVWELEDSNLTIDLDGHNITKTSDSTEGNTFDVFAGTFTITDTSEGPTYGTVSNENGNSAVRIKGSTDPEAESYTVVTIGENVTLKASYAMFVTHNENHAYGVVVDIDGTLQGSTCGFYVNGSIKDTQGNVPKVNVDGTAVITTMGESGTAAGCGIYAAGYAIYNIAEGAAITGSTGIEIRAGQLNVSGGTITGTGSPLETLPNGNGSTTDGAGIAVVQHTSKLPLKVTIAGGTITGYTALYEANTQDNDDESIAKVSLLVSGGTFNTSDGSTGSALYSEDCTGFVSGGTFSSAVDEDYCAEGYIPTVNEDGTYGVKVGTYVASVTAGDGTITKYESVQAAIDAATDGSTVTMLADATENVTIASGQSITLDLAGNTLSTTGILLVEGDLTVTDSSDGDDGGTGKISYAGTKTNTAPVRVTGSFTLDAGTINNELGYGVYCLDGGSATVNGGSIASKYAPLSGNNTTGDMNFTVNGGTLTAELGPAIYMPGQVTLTITGGTVNGGISLRMGQVEISGGTINAMTDAAKIDSIEKYYDFSGNVWLADALYVMAGTYTSTNSEYDNSLDLSITGGTFNSQHGSAVAIYDLGKVEQQASAEISGGTFNGADGKDAYTVLDCEDLGIEDGSYGVNSGEVESAISGGSFSSAVDEAYCAEGYAPTTVIDGVYTVIEATDISGAAVTVAADDLTYTGSAIEPDVTVTLADGTVLAEGDYTVSYSDNTDAGTASVTVTGTGVYNATSGKAYTGSVTVAFEIAKATIDADDVGIDSTVYDGNAKEVTVTVGGNPLTAGSDYEVSYMGDRTSAGTFYALVVGAGNYTGTVLRAFAITSAAASEATVSVAEGPHTYTGEAIEPAVTVTLADGTVLVEGTDYTVAYENNVAAGTATVTVSFAGNYAGTDPVSETFTIAAADASGATVSVAEGSVYDGNAKTPAVTVTLADGTVLTAGTDYTVAYENNTAAGTGTAKVTFAGNYTGTATASFEIAKADVESVAVAEIGAQDFNGYAVEPAVTVTYGGATLSEGADYTVSYSDNVQPGTATATVTLKGNYSGTVTATFEVEVPATKFTDVDYSLNDDGSYSAWYTDAVDYMYALGLMTGYSDDDGNMTWVYGVGDTLTRAQLSSILWRIAEPDEYEAWSASGTYGSNTTGMGDVADGAWYTDAANWAVGEGVISGKVASDGTRFFDPNAEVTLEQFCRIMACFVLGEDAADALPSSDLSGFADGSSVASWANPSVTWAVSAGLVSGYDRTSGKWLEPKEGVQRQRAATLLMNAFKSGLLKMS